MDSIWSPTVKKYAAATVLPLLWCCWMTAFATAGESSAPAAEERGVDDAHHTSSPNAPTPVFGYEVVESFPHDPGAFTQGLVFEKGYFYESTGLYGKSSLRKVEVPTGKVVKRHDLPGRIFGEGLALYHDTLIQLTWRAGAGFVYNKESLALVRQFIYSTEGWGLTFDGKRLIMTDGSSSLYFLDPTTFIPTGAIEVRDSQGPVFQLNELEFVCGEIWANVLPTDRIARIDPDTGRVTGWIDLTGLLSVERPEPARKPLNGIAYDSVNDRLFVTGKLWPKVFEIKIVPSESARASSGCTSSH